MGGWSYSIFLCTIILLTFFGAYVKIEKDSFPKHPFFEFPRFFALSEFSHVIIHNGVSFEGFITRPVSLVQFQHKFLAIIAGF